MNSLLNTVMQKFLAVLFPERRQEKILQTLSETDIALLPKPTEELPHIISLFSYKDKKVQALIWELKYHKNSHALSLVGKILAETISAEFSDKMLFENWTSATLVAIPMTNKHLRERTFSQTDLLCKEIIKNLSTDLQKQISYNPHALQKIRETQKQSHTKNRAERLQNLHNCFQANQNIIRGENIILIDDVTTTGATISEAIRALKAGGAKHIMTCTLAH